MIINILSNCKLGTKQKYVFLLFIPILDAIFNEHFMLISAYQKGFKSYLQLERGMSQNTITAYLHDTGLFLSWKNQSYSKLSLKEITIKELNEFIISIVDLDVGAYTQARIISGLKSFFKYLLLEKIIETNPCELIEAPKLGRKLPDVLTIDEVERVINSVDLSQNEGERNKAILEILYGCGLRVSELISLSISNLHLNEGVILVTGKGNKQRLVPIGEKAAKQLRTYLTYTRPNINVSRNSSDTVFLNRRGNSLTRQMIFYIVKLHVEKAGIKKNISPHSFRHSYATHLVQNGADLRVVQELLGHVSITTTEIYTHLNRDDLRKAILKYHPRNK